MNKTMKKVWVIITNFVEEGEEKINDVAVFTNEDKAKQEFDNFVFLAKTKSEQLHFETFLDEKTAFESLIDYDVNNNHIFVRMVEKPLID